MTQPEDSVALDDIQPSILGGRIPQDPYPRDLTTIEMRPIDADYQIKALKQMLAHLVYGQDALVQQIVAEPPRDSTTLVLFDSLTLAWEHSIATSWSRPLHYHQQKLLRALLNQKRLARFAEQTSPAHPRLPAAACQELQALTTRLAAAAEGTSIPARQRQAKALHGIVAPIVAPDTGMCR